jgi:Rv0623-like transcription factor
MPFSINDPEAEALVRKLAGKTGETEEQAVVQSVRERLERYDPNGSSSEPNPGYTPLGGGSCKAAHANRGPLRVLR